MQKKNIIMIIILTIVCLLIAGITNKDSLKNLYSRVIKIENLPNFEYNCYEQTADGKYITLVTFRDTNGIDKISYIDDNQKEININCENKTEVAIDYKTDNFVHNYFTTVSKTGERTINDLYLKVIVNEFSYTGNVQTFTAPSNGTYLLETWGSQGGGLYGGKGGYSKGEMTLTVGQSIYVYIGGQATLNYGGWNGGGDSSTYPLYYAGGGATDIRTIYSLNPLDSTSLNSRMIVAGAGGGGTSYSSTNAYGGYGGGLVGGNGDCFPVSQEIDDKLLGGGQGGTQISGGIGGRSNHRTAVGENGSLGKGGASNATYGGGGGSGYYGGGGGGWIWGNDGSGGGGSSYVGGVKNGETIAGNITIPSIDGKTEIGHSGNGYAKITFTQ